MPLVDVKNVTRAFAQGDFAVNALDDFSITFDEAEFTAIVGPSGSGKTTLLNCIGALDTPTSGQVIFDGVDLADLGKNDLADLRLHKIGFIFQAYNLIPVMTAMENVEYVLTLQGMEKKKRRDRARALFEEMNMADLEDRFPHELSGGQQQRVAVARALVSEPRLVLADEPTANLDSSNADRLLDIMQEMCDTKRTAFLFSTHDVRVMRKARRIIRMRDGKIEEEKNHNNH